MDAHTNEFVVLVCIENEKKSIQFEVMEIIYAVLINFWFDSDI